MPRDRHSLRAIAALEPAAKLVAGNLLTRLEQRTPEETDGLVDALAIIAQGTEEDRFRLAALSAERTADLWGRDRDKAWPWLQTWLSTDVAAAWSFVERALAAAPDDPRALLVQMLGIWAEDRFDVTAMWSALRRQPALLARMIPIVFRHLPPDEDPQHTGVYEVAAEDRAIDIRNRLPRLLEQIAGPEAHAALKALAAHADLAAVRPFFRNAVRRHGEAAAEGTAWTPARIVAFAAEHECNPRTPDDLFRLACNRLQAIRHDIEERDFGDRGLFPAKTDEITLQRYFAGRLERESRGRYDVTREEEVADHKEPDIRLRHPQAGVVSIEIKPLDPGRYSLAKLKDTLESQLVGQYMRAVDSRHGILLLCMIENRKWEIEKPDGTIDRSAGLPDLLRVLNDAAVDLVARRPDIDGLTVIGIDATPWEKAGKASEARKAKAPAKPGGRTKVKTTAPAEGT
ncbi:hypothetical protein [Azospirillum sp. B506]|uniref:hypothetical protein n=1 Tax=Azospirillum sp. B506 TaxID=137721 RepID=UPI00034AD772|nr:hypothetical protein [Azospirillum sp. B506]